MFNIYSMYKLQIYRYKTYSEGSEYLTEIFVYNLISSYQPLWVFDQNNLIKILF